MPAVANPYHRSLRRVALSQHTSTPEMKSARMMSGVLHPDSMPCLLIARSMSRMNADLFIGQTCFAHPVPSCCFAMNSFMHAMAVSRVIVEM